MDTPQCSCDEFFDAVCRAHGIQPEMPVAAIFFFTARLFFLNPAHAAAIAETDYVAWGKTKVVPLYVGAR